MLIVSKVGIVHRRLVQAEHTRHTTCLQQCQQHLPFCGRQQATDETRQPMVKKRAMKQPLQPLQMKSLLNDALNDLRQAELQCEDLEVIKGGIMEVAQNIAQRMEGLLDPSELVFSDEMLQLLDARKNVRGCVAMARELHDVIHQVVGQAADLVGGLEQKVTQFEQCILKAMQSFEQHLATGSEAGFVMNQLTQHNKQLKDCLIGPLEQVEAVLDAQVIAAMASACTDFCTDMFENIAV